MENNIVPKINKILPSGKGYVTRGECKFEKREGVKGVWRFELCLFIRRKDNEGGDQHHPEAILRCHSTSIVDIADCMDAVGKKMLRMIKRYKERKEGGGGGPYSVEGGEIPDHDSLEWNEEEDQEGEYEEEGNITLPVSDNDVDPDLMDLVVKTKNFDLTHPISVKEAVFCLRCVGHDFYVFREKASEGREGGGGDSGVSIVYRRNGGGVGLIRTGGGGEMPITL